MLALLGICRMKRVKALHPEHQNLSVISKTYGIDPTIYRCTHDDYPTIPAGRPPQSHGTNSPRV